MTPGSSACCQSKRISENSDTFFVYPTTWAEQVLRDTTERIQWTRADLIGSTILQQLLNQTENEQLPQCRNVWLRQNLKCLIFHLQLAAEPNSSEFSSSKARWFFSFSWLFLNSMNESLSCLALWYSSLLEWTIFNPMPLLIFLFCKLYMSKLVTDEIEVEVNHWD